MAGTEVNEKMLAKEVSGPRIPFNKRSPSDFVLFDILVETENTASTEGGD
jgi:hypothetical protein